MENDTHRHKDHIRKYLEEDAQDLYENAPCGYLSFAPDGTIVKINQTLLSWIDVEREDLLYRKKFSQLFNIGGRIFYETHFAPLLRMQNSIKEINFDIVKADGATLPVLVSCTPVTDNEGETVLYRATVFDITERKKYERELLRARKEAEQAARAKANFISTVSHEIRTPMNAIIGIAELLIRNNPKLTQMENLQMLKHSSSHLLNLINDILDFSKIEAGKVKLERRNFDLRALVESIVFSLKNKAEEKGISIRTEWDDDVPNFYLGDPVKISQIITNLLGNAIKFTEKGYVAFSVQLREQKKGHCTLALAVRDTGTGIAPDQLENIFEEFTQESYDTGAKFGGTGLGLSISRKLLELHKSQLKVKSELGQGTEFYFDLNLKVGKEEIKTEPVPAEKQASIRGIHLLLVEDNHVNVMVAGQFLQSWGVSYDVAENGKQALAMVTRHKYDMVLMDLQMPEMNGYEAARAIRSMPEDKYQRLPIIALSATSESDLPQVEEMGMNAYVKKPFTADDLQAKIAQFAPKVHIAKAVHVDGEENPDTDPDEVAEAGVNMQFFHKITKGNRQDMLKIINLLLNDFRHFRSVFPTLLTNDKRKQFESEVHKLNAVLQHLNADRLMKLIEDMRIWIGDNPGQQPPEELTWKIDKELQAALEIFEQEAQSLR